MPVTSWWAEFAALPGGLSRSVRFEVADGRFVSVAAGASAGGARLLPGVVLPGFANAHSHAFHRALRGRTHLPDSGGRGSFRTWREQMYAVAQRLEPESYLSLATALYAEMVLAGITSVGEFHYLHHAPSGKRYADPNAMGLALRQAAEAAGIRLTLLDTVYLRGGLTGEGHLPLTGAQLRFGDGSVSDWASRVLDLRPAAGFRLGAAIHSVRAVPREALAEMGSVLEHGLGGRADGERVPLHVHLSERAAENQACRTYYGCTPTALLAEHGVLGSLTTAVHATHLDRQDLRTLGRTRTVVCACPTTERDLGDGIGPMRQLAEAGAPLSLGTDQHAVVDMFEEARGLELHERLATGVRPAFTPGELLAAVTHHASIGWPDAGRLEPGARADLVAVRLDSVRTAGCDPAQVLMAATAADVDSVVVDGRVVVEGGRHRLGDVPAMLARGIRAVWG